MGEEMNYNKTVSEYEFWIKKSDITISKTFNSYNELLNNISVYVVATFVVLDKFGKIMSNIICTYENKVKGNSINSNYGKLYINKGKLWGSNDNENKKLALLIKSEIGEMIKEHLIEEIKTITVLEVK
jgi:hypothetical protein